ncbi:ATP-binding protein [Segetibacter koreensis]|uniref:ATP-binding protein n=1 Tax=Segetibacter koreensis TaxID=398037 RepID=UPI0003652681|nr:ATP-binding protein [Segetibacter koreensis]
MKKITIILCLLCLTISVIAQTSWQDSVKNLLASAKDDTTKFKLLSPLVTYYTYSKPDSAIIYAQKQISIAKKNRSASFLSAALTGYGGIFSIIGNYPLAIYFELEGLKAAESAKDFLAIGWSYDYLTSTYTDAGDFEHAFFYSYKERSLAETHYKLSRDSAEKSAFSYLYNTSLYGFAIIFDKLNQPDSALKYMQIINGRDAHQYGWIDSTRFHLFGNIFFKKGDYLNALKYYRDGYKFAAESHINNEIMSNCNGIAKTFWKNAQTDSSIYYANKVLEASQHAQYPLAKLEALDLLAEIYKSKGECDSAVKYLNLTLTTKDNLFSQQKVIQTQSMTFNEQLRQQDILDAQEKYWNKIKTYILIGGIAALLLITSLLLTNNMHKQKAKVQIEKAYDDLKSTQAQLIQFEKMASLGKLTAGIAHEIQNPLNFVNNFSDVNTELIAELQTELKGGNIEEAFAISNDLKENEQKINHHGKRADATVKGMLQHSRASTGKKEPTDINALSDEYLRLSYHGLRAKDKSFNATIETHFDESIGKIEVVPQDIGRVLLNLFNNAFYAVSEKKKQLGGTFEPTVEVYTKRENDKVIVAVRDNGVGIPTKIVDKIFQPFFTTKPTGQGTGLGLSLSYDIVKAHGGELKVHSKEGEGSEFTIYLLG